MLSGARRPGRAELGVTDRPVSPSDVLAALDVLAEDGVRAAALAAEVDRRLLAVRALSELTAPLALGYLDRLRHPLRALSPVTAVRVLTRGYLAHMVVEGDPGAYGADDVPVLGTLPPLGRDGRAPQDLSIRVVKATRRNFSAIRAVNDGAWEGLVTITTATVHDQARPDGEGRTQWLERSIVDSLLRFGWVLRQVDLHYRLEPELA